MLPPHLQIEPIRRAAPSPPRRLALLTTLAADCALLGWAVWYLGVREAALPPVPPRPAVTIQLVEEKPEGAAAPKGTGTVDPKLAKEQPAPDLKPLDDFQSVPSRLLDRPEQARFDPALPQAPGGDGHPESRGGEGQGVDGVGIRGMGNGTLRMKFQDMQILNRVQPEYPLGALLGREEDAVVLEVTIDEHGVPVVVKAIQSKFPVLAKEAIRAIKLWRFAIVKDHGVPVKATFLMDVNFIIANNSHST